MSAIVAASPVIGIVPHGNHRHEYQAGGVRLAVFDDLSHARAFAALGEQYNREMDGRRARGFHVETFEQWVLGIVAQLRGQHGEDSGAVADWQER